MQTDLRQRSCSVELTSLVSTHQNVVPGPGPGQSMIALVGTGFDQMKVISFSQGTVATFYR